VKRKELGILVALVLVALLLSLGTIAAPTALAKDDKKVGSPKPMGPAPITLNNGIIDIVFGEQCCEWGQYDGYNHIYLEEPAMSYGANLPTWLSYGTVIQAYPALGNPGTWYEAIIDLDLDGDAAPDVRVHRWVMLPPGQKYFMVCYTLDTLKGAMDNFRFFQGVDYDVGGDSMYDEAGYRADFVWEYEDGYGCTGFTGSCLSVHHDVNEYSDMWNDIEAGILNDVNYLPADDRGVALEWDLGTVAGSHTLGVAFGFADTLDELATVLSNPAWSDTLCRCTPTYSSGSAGDIDHSTGTAGGAQSTNLRTGDLRIAMLRVPGQTVANQPMTITANVVNDGSETGSKRVALKINGQVEQTKMVTVGGSSSRPVKFTVTKAGPGTYTVTMGSQRASFVVTEDTAGGKSADGGVIAIMLLVLLAAAVVIVLAVSFNRRTA
jgi:hypothetical protein